MPRLPKRNVLTFILRVIAELEVQQIIRVENHKNDRFLELRKTGDQIQVKEDGYTNTTHTVDPSDLKSLMNKLIEYEFPRSHQLRIKIRRPDENSDIGMSPWSARKMK